MLLMRRKISSKLTGFHKFAAPVLLVVFAALTILIMATRTPRVTTSSLVLVTLFTAVICVPLIWFSSRLKHVSIDEQFLYIEHGNNEEKIPLSHIAEVNQTRWIKPFPVSIRLAGYSDNSRKILFIPQMQGLKGARNHPIVGELNRLKSVPHA